MRHSIRLSIAALALAGAAACSHSSEQPVLTDDLKQDLAKAGGGDVQLAGAAVPRLDVVSSAERTQTQTPTPKSPAVSRAPSAIRGHRAVVRSVHHDTPAPAQPSARADDITPAEAPAEVRAPEPIPAAAGRPQAPVPSTQREPRGGWKTPGQIIRNAPFPINP